MAMRATERRKLNPASDYAREQLENLKASVRAKVEHPVRRAQAAVRLQQGSLERSGEERGADRHAVRAVESVDGTARIGESKGISASGMRLTRPRAAAMSTRSDLACR